METSHDRFTPEAEQKVEHPAVAHPHGSCQSKSVIDCSVEAVSRGYKEVNLEVSAPQRVYVLAFACEPGRGSEPGVGYNFAEALARMSTDDRREFVLLTRPHTIRKVQEALSAAIGHHSLSIQPVSIPMWIVKLTKRKRVRLAYILWQFVAVQKLRRDTRDLEEPFVVHHVTFATEALPTFENRLGPNARRVFGPAGSSQEINNAERPGVKNRLRSQARKYFGQVNLRRASVAVASNDLVASVYSGLGAPSVIVEPNIVVDSISVTKAINQVPPTEFFGHELICVGLLRDRKRIHMAIEALSLLEDRSLKLLIVGNGPMEASLREASSRFGVEKRVTFAGKQTREDTLALMAQARCLVHPARQEGSGWVIGEAQSVGAVPIVIAGSGAETAVRLGGQGLVVENSPQALADAIRIALNRGTQPTHRWSELRLPGMLSDWYDIALSN